MSGNYNYVDNQLKNPYAKNELYNQEISTWSTDETLLWLKSLKLQQYLENFKANHISGYDLCLITNEELKTELKIMRLHDRNLMLKSIRTYLLKQCND